MGAMRCFRRPRPLRALRAGARTAPFRGLHISVPQRHGHGHSDGHGHGHAHDHAPHLHLLGGCHDQSNSSELADMKGDAIRVTLLGFGCNCFLGGLQWLAGSYCHSAALTSDAVHTLTDSLSDIITLGVVQVAMKPPSPGWPYGRGKLDSLAALGVSGIMMTTGMSAMRLSATLLQEALMEESLPDTSHDHSHSHGHGHVHSHGSGSLFQDGHMNAMAVGTCLVTIGSKEGLYRVTRAAAERLHSSVLLANAWHHRSDALTSGMVLLGVLGRVFVHNALDPAAGCVLSAIILRISWGIGRRAVMELLDMQLPQPDLEKFRDSLEAGLEGPAQSSLDARFRLEHLHGRRAGPEVHLELLLSFPG
ncbi:unnamed protein product, partial [Effrenium voratum]